MRGWRKICTVVSVILLAVILLLHQFGSPFTHYQMEQRVRDYLYRQGYQQDALLKLDSVYDKNARNKYVVEVVFAEDPETTHYFYYDSEAELQETEQIGK